MKVKELIDKINSADMCYSVYAAKRMIEGKYKLVAKNMYLERFRWYGVSTSVYKLEDGYVGIRGVSELYNAMITFSDLEIYCVAEEYEECTVVSYKPKR